MVTIVLRGDGIAALTCGYMLQSAGFGVSIERAPRAYVPALMLSASSQALFRDVLQLQDPFATLLRIQKRVVKWGPHAEPVAFPHSSVIVSEQFLLEMVMQNYSTQTRVRPMRGIGRSFLPALYQNPSLNVALDRKSRQSLWCNSKRTQITRRAGWNLWRMAGSF